MFTENCLALHYQTKCSYLWRPLGLHNASSKLQLYMQCVINLYVKNSQTGITFFVFFLSFFLWRYLFACTFNSTSDSLAYGCNHHVFFLPTCTFLFLIYGSVLDAAFESKALQNAMLLGKYLPIHFSVFFFFLFNFAIIYHFVVCQYQHDKISTVNLLKETALGG